MLLVIGMEVSLLNQNPEQLARDKIDELLRASGWLVQSKTSINLNLGLGIAVREFQTDIGPVDYVLFVDKKPVGVLEAKKEDEGFRLNIHEEQVLDYSKASLKYQINQEPLSYIYLSTGSIIHFTDATDPKPRFREIFTFHRPETLRDWQKAKHSIRSRLQDLPVLNTYKLRDCQTTAINTLEDSFKHARPKALIQMATGSGKTFTAITFIYRLLKHCNAKKVLFLVDTRNLGEQAEQEFISYLPNDDNRKFTELYNVARLQSSYIPPDSQVYITTIQRLYAILKGEELKKGAEDIHPTAAFKTKQPQPVEYSAALPIEYFDFIVIDECHRSIYNLWKQVLEYFDAFLIGLTATPDKRTFAFFNQNVVSEYTHENAVADGVNVGYDVFLIETEITAEGAKINCGEFIETREKWSRKKYWTHLDDDLTYTGKQLDRDIVNHNQIRTILQAYKDNLGVMFPGRAEPPKTLIFAKDDSHADDIVHICREVFDEGNEFCKKITYITDNPKSVLAQFRNSFNPRIAVTVDMIATGTDVKPLECLIFMRDVKSRNYFEQMKGRGTRVISLDDLQKVTPSAVYTKDHFIIVDAIGVTKTTKTDSRPLERKPTTPLKDLLGMVTVGVKDEEVFTSLAGRLARLEQVMTKADKEKFTELATKPVNVVIRELLNAYDPDQIESEARQQNRLSPEQEPTPEQTTQAQEVLAGKAAESFNGDLNSFVEKVRRTNEQTIDNHNPDRVRIADWSANTNEEAIKLIDEFKAYIIVNKDEITALQFFYAQPFQRRQLTHKMVKELVDKLKADKPNLAPSRVWQAYEQLDKLKHSSPKSELVALVSLIRRVIGLDEVLIPFNKTIDKNFQDWVFAKQAGALKFNEEQMTWLRMIKEHITSSFSVDKDALEYTPFIEKGGLNRMWELFGDKVDDVIAELNYTLIA